MGRGSHERSYKLTDHHIHKVFESQREKHNYVIDSSISLSDYIAIDLSNSNSELSNLDLSQSEDLGNYIQQYLHKHNAKVAYGGYLEVRNIYKRSHQFACDDTRMERNIHLGMDFWCEIGTPVLAVLDGQVHSFQNNKAMGDYGPTIILEHHVQGETFHTLYGHLSLESLKGLKVGQKMKEGEIIGTVGDPSINGDYAPHLHFQIIEDMQGLFGDYPGVSCQDNIKYYRDNCPNPNLLLNL